jgi:AcrR family transcriptional regulator
VGRPPRLSREAIVTTAEAIVDQHGIEALTMRSVAKELGSSPMALYRHVRDKDELLLLMLDRAAAELPRTSLPDDPRARLLELFQILYDGLAARPWVVSVIVKGDLIAPSVLWAIDEIVAAFVACGLSPRKAGAAYLVAWRFTVGHLVVRYETARRSAELDRTPRTLSTLAKVQATEFPMLAKLKDFWPTARKHDTYAEDLAAVVDGLLARA